MYTQDNDGRFWYYDWWYDALKAWDFEGNVFFCPVAAKVNTNPAWAGSSNIFGSKLTAWQYSIKPGYNDMWPDGKDVRGSYGLNWWVTDKKYSSNRETLSWYWNTYYVEHPDRVPVFADCINFAASPHHVDKPPGYDDELLGYMTFYAINRHDGGINSLFMDSSVRKVGLKELWTLKWHRKFDTENRWTMAGGVQPAYWPGWMRRFKDY